MTSPKHSLRKRFLAELSQGDDQINLAGAALMVAREEYLQLPEERYLSQLDLLAEETRDRLDDETAPLLVLQELLNTLYNRHGFRGNRDAYYDPRNSFLNDVLDRRLGIPLTLGIVVLEVGWRLGLPLEGVNFPGDLSLSDSSNRRIATHLPYGIQVGREQTGVCTHASRCQGSFGTGVPSSNNKDIEIVADFHGTLTVHGER